MIITLGVDYSIFLMMRYNEVEDKGSEGIIDAAKHMGGVVLSAALILGGTFAALIPSGYRHINASSYFSFSRTCIVELHYASCLFTGSIGLT